MGLILFVLVIGRLALVVVGPLAIGGVTRDTKEHCSFVVHYLVEGERAVIADIFSAPRLREKSICKWT